MRRAWIEIWLVFDLKTLQYPVALHAESVDRNCGVRLAVLRIYLSLSMRRAWIEIRQRNRTHTSKTSVALHAESVDRNILSLPQ